MLYVTYADDGKLTGCFDQELRQEHAGRHIEITRQQRAIWASCRATADRTGIEPAPPAAPSTDEFNAAIDDKIVELEQKQARPLRDIVVAQLTGAGVAAADRQQLIDLKTQIDDLRAQRR